MARSVVNDPLQKFKYVVSIPGLPNGMGFNKVSALKRELGTVEYTEGGYSHTHKLVGRETVEAVTLERGMFASKDLENLYLKSLNDPNFRTTVTITLQDRFGKAQRTWKLAEAWVKSWEGSDFDSSSEDVAIEKVVVEFEYYL